MATLAERLRPTNLEEFVGQSHLFKEGGLLDLLLKRAKPFSLIFWGPPGTGKTTLAHLLAKKFVAHFQAISAVDSSIKELKELISQAERLKRLGQRTILFIDEIHRFNKAQQSFLLPYVEREDIFLFGATTENPSFEVISPLLSRVKIIKLLPLDEQDILSILKRALQDKERGLGDLNLKIEEEVLRVIARVSLGDARFALNTLEILVEGSLGRGIREIKMEHLKEALPFKPLLYDKGGEEHYNLISAYHKSLRGSDPDGAIYWLVRMLKAGEDPLYVARRLLICAAEDVGLADPLALVIALSAFQAYEVLGSPEGDIALAMATLYVALAPKSNSAYLALKEAEEEVERSGYQEVPLHLRNPVTLLMEKMGYGKGYLYPHDFKGAFVEQLYLPSNLRYKRFYRPKTQGFEKKLKKRLIRLWRNLKDLAQGT
ncbi:MAG: replication-associated recombination protein A [Caldimicrobium sp.]|nr:replication-associated recombination protein A [Caldimicrobium sp.]MCX7873365.1 replication-associated recombination protein A [Caldimicrobium sp.]MDW8093396.1 replication-associated recombination protein A [Caldimicrobium sp.]